MPPSLTTSLVSTLVTTVGTLPHIVKPSLSTHVGLYFGTLGCLTPDLLAKYAGVHFDASAWFQAF